MGATGLRVVALIPAAGSGERLGYLSDDSSRVAKALVPCAGKPLLAWSLLAFSRSIASAAVVAAPAQAIDSMREVVAGSCPGDFPVTVVAGGASRSESVALALAAAAGIGEFDFAAVHDAARPLIRPASIDACVNLAAGDDELAGAILAAPVADTIKRIDASGRITQTLDRSMLWAAQTPQVFRIAALEGALGADPGVLRGATDDSSLVEAAGGKMAALDAGNLNLKVTTAADLALAAQVLAARSAS